jgi:hypothetical protein
VAQKSDVPVRARQSRMLLQHRWIFHVIQIRIRDRRAVQFHRDPAPVGGDLFVIPLADRLQESRLRGDNIVNRTMVLRRLQPSFVLRIVVIEDLDLHPNVRCITLVGSADADPIIRPRSQFELEPENEVRVGLFGKQVPAAFLRTNDHAVARGVTGSDASDEPPAVERLAVKERRIPDPERKSPGKKLRRQRR